MLHHRRLFTIAASRLHCQQQQAQRIGAVVASSPFSTLRSLSLNEEPSSSSSSPQKSTSTTPTPTPTPTPTHQERDHSKMIVRQMENQARLLNEEPVNFQQKSYERVGEYLQTQEVRRKREEEDEDYRFEDKLIPRKSSTLYRELDQNILVRDMDQVLSLFGFTELSPEVDKSTIEALQGMNPLVSNFMLIDVRGRMAAKHYTIPGSVNIPLSELTSAFELTNQDFRHRYGVHKPGCGKSLIFLSEDQIETELACQFMRTFVDGYNLVYNYRGGIQDWFGATYKQLWRRSYISDYKLLLRYDKYGKIQRNMIRSVKELTEEE